MFHVCGSDVFVKKRTVGSDDFFVYFSHAGT